MVVIVRVVYGMQRNVHGREVEHRLNAMDGMFKNEHGSGLCGNLFVGIIELDQEDISRVGVDGMYDSTVLRAVAESERGPASDDSLRHFSSRLDSGVLSTMRSGMIEKVLFLRRGLTSTRRMGSVSTVTRTSIPIQTSALLPFIADKGKWSQCDNTAIKCATTGHSIKYSELASRICAAGLALRNLGFKRGDTVNIHLHNSVEFVVGFFATLHEGGVVTTSNPAYTATELAHCLSDSGATFSLTSRVYDQVMTEAIRLSGGSMRRVSYIEEDGCFARPQKERQKPSRSVDPQPLALGQTLELKYLHFDPLTQVAAIPYSSGTTGIPKGVCLTHQNLVANVQQCMDEDAHNIGITSKDRLVGILPLYHIYGLTVLMCVALAARATVVLLPRFQPESFLKCLQDEKVTMAMIAPPLAIFLAKHPLVNQYDLSSLCDVFSGAAPLDASTQSLLSTRLNCTVRQGYGMTELSPIVSFCSKGVGSIGGAVGSAGVVAPSTSIKTIDIATGDELPVGSEGELCVKGPQVMLGYLNRQEATRETMTSDGFLRTGDLARIDEGGTIWIGERVKELIKVKGFQVAPAELEGLLLEMPQIADACVIGIPDERAGEVPKCFIVIAENHNLSVEQIQAHLHPKVARFKWPKEYEYIDRIPKSASGKILRRLLRNDRKKI